MVGWLKARNRPLNACQIIQLIVPLLRRFHSVIDENAILPVDISSHMGSSGEQLCQ